MGTATLFVRHQVADYAAWRAAYETLEDLRQQHGVGHAEVLIDPNDKNDVFVIHRFASLQAAQDFAHNPQLREGMTKAGVVGTPRVEIAVEA